jgi:pilus assembly protein CpaC
MRRSVPRTFSALGTAIAMMAVGMTPPASAQSYQGGYQQQTAMLGGPGQVVRMPLSAGQRTQSVSMPRGTSGIVDFGAGAIKNVVVGDPTIADVQSMTASTFVILAKQPGRTDVHYFDGAGREVLTQNVLVQMDISALDTTIQRVAPAAQVHSEVIGQNILLSGQVANAAENDLVVRIARTFVAKPENVVNALSISGQDQVRLDVRVVEVNRTVIKQLGFNTNALFGQLGSDQISIGNTPSYAINGGFQGGVSGGYKLDTTKQPVIARDVQVPVQVYDATTGTYHTEYQIKTYDFIDGKDLLSTAKDSIGKTGLNQATAMIQAFERQGLLRTLAEPNLTTVSGEAARFLAGGEYPVPTGRDNSGNTTIEFKPYGVGVGFTPVVLSGGRISLKISVEVSELTSQGALTLSGVAGAGTSTVIPALNVRRAENVVELSSGGSAQIAGLLQETTRQNIDKVPGVADMPVLGALARSRDFLNNETELVIIVTAYLVNQVRPDQLQTPADGLRIASDSETNLLGRLNHAYKAPAEPTVTAAPPPRSYEGPIGHVIE